MEKRKPSHYIWFVLASIALHLLFFFGFIFLNNLLFFSELFKRLDHEIVDKTEDLSAQIELVDIKENQRQIVEQDEKANKKKPEESDYLSRDDQTVKEQTKARLNGAFKNSSPSPAQPQAAQSSPTVPAKKMLQSRPPFRNSAPLGLAGLTPSNDLDEIMKRQEEYQKQQKQSPLSQASPPSPFSGPSMTDDYLEDVKEGDFTRLNTRRFEHYSFYSRVKGQLRSHWNPLIRQEVYFIFSTTRSLASLDKKRTTLRVTLDKNGYLKQIELLTTSGNRKIDMAAIQAFRTAAPFPNPPKELLEKDGHLRLFWDFVLET
jgi:protein TonB